MQEQASTFSAEDIELDITDEMLVGRKSSGGNFKNYKNNTVYNVAITSATNVKTPWGAAQVELVLQACDEDGNVVGVPLKQWVGYPFNSKTQETPMDAATINRLRDDIGGILRARSPEKFAFYGSIEGQGKSKKYFDKDGNELDAGARIVAQKEGNRRILLAAKDLMLNPEAWLGHVGYATYKEFTRKNGKTGRAFQNFSHTPSTKLPLVTELSEMYAE